MTFHYRVTGEDRKVLVKAMGEILECSPVYMKMPTRNYEVGGYTVAPNGDVTFDDMTDSEEVEMLAEALLERGFEPEAAENGADGQTGSTNDNEQAEDKPEPDAAPSAGTETPAAEEPAKEPTGEEPNDLVVSLPMDGFDAGSLNRLHTLVASKRTLLCRALDTDTLPVQVESDRVSFPWFHGGIDADHAKAYTDLIVRLCDMAKNSRRVTAKDKPAENEKYAFRCFLLRLGFIGNEYKRTRRILLEKLEGSSAFRSGAPKPQTSPTSGAETEVVA